jgi:hypothetical protein
VNKSKRLSLNEASIIADAEFKRLRLKERTLKKWSGGFGISSGPDEYFDDKFWTVSYLFFHSRPEPLDRSAPHSEEDRATTIATLEVTHDGKIRNFLVNIQILDGID